MAIALLGLIGSLVCPPVSERDDPADAARVRPRTGAAPPALDLEPAGAEAAERTSLPMSGSHALRIEVRDADADLPLPAAAVELRYEDRAGRALSSSARLSADGRVRLEGLPANRYEVAVSLSGFFPAAPQRVELPALEEPLLRFALRPAARIEGELRTVDGTPVASGVVRLARSPGGEFHLCPIDPRGDRFASPPLEAGVWRLEFLEYPGALPLAELSADLAVVPRQTLRVELTIQRPGMTPLPDRRPGLRLLLD